MSKNNLIIFIIAVFFLQPAFGASAQDLLGQEAVFVVDSSFDAQGRKEITAVQVKTSRTAYWFLEKNIEQNQEVSNSINSLAQELEENIYPTLTKVFGSEWTPGIDKDTRITILIHPMKEKRGGYFNSADEYPKAQIPDSNEREMVYINSDYLASGLAKSFLAHELVHLITFNQKEKRYDVSEDIWLNEARADYASTILGYDKEYRGSNLQKRVQEFLDRPSDSLTEWRETPGDYGVANLVVQYIVDHYGVGILTESLKIKQTGIASLNTILSRQGFKEDFSQIFTNWAIAVLVNDCQVSEKYCYYNQHLKDLRITPLVNYLPFSGESILSVTNNTKDWAGNWHRFVGGSGQLKIEFKTDGRTTFRVPYIIKDFGNNSTVGYLSLDPVKGGQISIDNFGEDYASLTILPIAQSKISGFFGIQPSYSFFWSASTKEKTQEVVQGVNSEKERIIQDLKNQIMAVQLKIIELLRQLIQLLLTQLSPSASM